MRLLSNLAHHQSGDPARWSRLGVAGATFFLVKGLLWLLAPVLFTLWR
jgi:hypothetical protein